jgi:hypothetical protein
MAVGDNKQIITSISSNPLLSVCDVSSVCGYLQITGKPYFIKFNAPGCDSASEILASCQATSVESFMQNFAVYPNPASDRINIINCEGNIDIINASGLIVKSILINNAHFTVDISDLIPGIYCIKTAESVQKIVKL